MTSYNPFRIIPVSKSLSFSNNAESVYFDFKLPANLIVTLERHSTPLDKTTKGFRISHTNIIVNLIDRDNPIAVEHLLVINGKFLSISILVNNYGYAKTITIHYTFDNWKTINDQQASFDKSIIMPDNVTSNHLGKDRFKVYLNLDLSLKNCDLQFAVKYEVNSQVYWNNNSGFNFKIYLTNL
jgi:hypothetical protein